MASWTIDEPGKRELDPVDRVLVRLIEGAVSVVGSDGRMHGYSAAGGIATKQRLLEMELASRIRAGVAEVVDTT